MSAAVEVDPEVGSLPVQPPEAVQPVAFALLQVKLLTPPDTTEAGAALSDTVGAGFAGAEKTTAST